MFSFFRDFVIKNKKQKRFTTEITEITEDINYLIKIKLSLNFSVKVLKADLVTYP